MQTSHQDISRQDVGYTACIVAHGRHLETVKGDTSLIVDPYAKCLSELHINEDRTKGILLFSNKERDSSKESDFVSIIAVRTRTIDDLLLEFLKSGIKQVVVFGAGLDARPWRLGIQSHIISLSDSKLLENVEWFEVDFTEIFQYKLPILADNKATTKANYHPVEANLCLSDWMDRLVQSGFKSDQKCICLLEGLINYLTLEEATSFFITMSSNVISGSRILTTSLSSISNKVTTMHRFKPDDPLAFVSQFGWEGKQTNFTEISFKYGRTINDPWEGYVLVDAQKC